MGDKSKIEWTDATWNVITGCSKVSSGCKNCYAERIWKRVYGKYRPFTDVHFHEDRLEMPLRWKRPRRIFVNSLSDLFHEKVTVEMVAAIFGIMTLASRHIFQILTKRPERAFAMLRNLDAHKCAHEAFGTIGASPTCDMSHEWPLPNVWLGVSVENQGTAEERIPLLLNTPAAVRWISVEPLLGPVNLGPWIDRLDWVVVGGESGPKARAFDVEWARQIKRRCTAADVAFFMKQLGSRPFDGTLPLILPGKADQPEKWPVTLDDIKVREYPA